MKWIDSKRRWSLALTRPDLMKFLQKLEAARNAQIEYWYELFTIPSSSTAMNTQSQSQSLEQSLSALSPAATVLDVQYCAAKLKSALLSD
jgi:hypothetical protein